MQSSTLAGQQQQRQQTIETIMPNVEAIIGNQETEIAAIMAQQLNKTPTETIHTTTTTTAMILTPETTAQNELSTAATAKPVNNCAAVVNNVAGVVHNAAVVVNNVAEGVNNVAQVVHNTAVTSFMQPETEAPTPPTTLTAAAAASPATTTITSTTIKATKATGTAQGGGCIITTNNNNNNNNSSLKKKRNKSVNKRTELEKLNSSADVGKLSVATATTAAAIVTGDTLVGVGGGGVSGGSGGQSSIKTSLSMTSLPPADEKQESRDVIKARLRVERPYNSLKKNADRSSLHLRYAGNNLLHMNGGVGIGIGFGGAGMQKNKNKHNRYSWGSNSSSSLHGFGSSCKDDLWTAIQTNYNYIMDTNLLDTCKEARGEIESATAHATERPQDGRFKVLDDEDVQRNECCSIEEPKDLRRWLREMEQKLEHTPTLSEATLLSTAELQYQLAEHSVLYHEIVSHARVVSACIRAASEREKQQQQQQEDREQQQYCTQNIASAEPNLSSLSSTDEQSLKSDETTAASTSATVTSSAATSNISTGITTTTTVSKKSAGNLERLQNRYHLLYLKAFEVQLWLDSLLRKKASNASNLNGDFSDCDIAGDATDDDLVGVATDLESDAAENSTSSSEIDNNEDVAAQKYNNNNNNSSNNNTVNNKLQQQRHCDCNGDKGDCEDGDDEEEDDEDEDEIDCSRTRYSAVVVTAGGNTFDASGNIGAVLVVQNATNTTLTDFEADSESSDLETLNNNNNNNNNHRRQRKAVTNTATATTGACNLSNICANNNNSNSNSSNVNKTNNANNIFSTDVATNNNDVASITTNMQQLTLNAATTNNTATNIVAMDSHSEIDVAVAVNEQQQQRQQQYHEQLLHKSQQQLQRNSLLHIHNNNNNNNNLQTIATQHNTVSTTSCTAATQTQIVLQQKQQQQQQLLRTPSVKAKNIAIISPNCHNGHINNCTNNNNNNNNNCNNKSSSNSYNNSNNNKSPNALRKRTQQRHAVDISKFNRSNRKSKNCAIFYFKHLDTDNETNYSGTNDANVGHSNGDSVDDCAGSGGLSSSASHASDLIKSADASSDDDDDEEEEEEEEGEEDGGWLYSATPDTTATAASTTTAAANNSECCHSNGICICSIDDALQSSTISSSSSSSFSAAATAAAATAAATVISDDSDKENKEATVAACAELQLERMRTVTAAATATATTTTTTTKTVTVTASSTKANIAVNSNNLIGDVTAATLTTTTSTTTTTTATSHITQMHLCCTAMEQQLQQQQQHINGQCKSSCNNNNSNNNSNNNNSIRNDNCYNQQNNGNNNNNYPAFNKNHQRQQQQNLLTAADNNGNNIAEEQQNNELLNINGRVCYYARADTSGFMDKSSSDISKQQQQQQQQLLNIGRKLPPRSPAKSIKSQKLYATNGGGDTLKSLSPTKQLSHESIKQLVLEAEHLVRDETSLLLKTPAKPKHCILKISSTVKKRELIMPGPVKQRVQEWLQHQPNNNSNNNNNSTITVQQLNKSHDSSLNNSTSAGVSVAIANANNGTNRTNDDCEASGEASETDSIQPPVGSDTSEGFTDSIATCMQTSTNSFGHSIERIGGSAEPIASHGVVLGYGSSNQSLNAASVVKIVKRQQSRRRKSERPWSVSCLSQLTTETAQVTTKATEASNVQAGLASHSISESALDSLSPGRRPRAASSTSVHHARPQNARNYESKGSLKRRKMRKKKISNGIQAAGGITTVGVAAAYAASKKTNTDSGSEESNEMTPKLTQSLLMKSCESMSTQQLQEITNALLTLQKSSVVDGCAVTPAQLRHTAAAAPKHQQQQQLVSTQHGSGGEEEAAQLMKPNFRVGSYTTAYMTNEARLGPLAALATSYMNDDEQQGSYTTGTEDHHSSFSETAWDNYQEKYNSENYSEGFDSDAARRLLEFGDDYRNFIDSQSDCCSSLSAANNLDSLSPPRMDSLTQQNELKIISQETIVSSVDHARRRRALELEYERRRKNLEVRRKSCQDSSDNRQTSPPPLPSSHNANAVSITSAAHAFTSQKNITENNAFGLQQQRHISEANISSTVTSNTLNNNNNNHNNAMRKLDFGMRYASSQSLRRTSESDTSTRRRKVVDEQRRRSSRNLEKSIKLLPTAANSSSSSCGDDSDDEKEMRNLLTQSQMRLEDTRSLKIRSHLLRPEDYNEIINTCRDNIHCLEAVLRGPPSTVLSAASAHQSKGESSAVVLKHASCQCSPITRFIARCIHFLLDVSNLLEHFSLYRFFISTLKSLFGLANIRVAGIDAILAYFRKDL